MTALDLRHVSAALMVRWLGARWHRINAEFLSP